ncbi:hypothetical protein FSP39_003209 [Pinctada imbricata]|uniref:Uncharacterized protein n=1 Tax=Pinctada imbricata TaxID=66713 RepID=A0AA88YAK3_PINIB|nr:hypothetical protein FSP39_003209 [Pinctada imbricata]
MGIKVTNYSKVFLFLTITLVAFILILVATFVDGWWILFGEQTVDPATGQRNCTLVRRTFSLWEKIHCQDVNGYYVCMLNNADNTDWILFVRCTCVFAVFLVFAMAVLQILFLCTEKKVLRYFAAVFSISAGFVTFLTALVLLGMFTQISNSLLTVPNRGNIPCNSLRYQTLPMAFLFLTGFLCNFIATGLAANVDKKRKRNSKFPGFGNSEPAPLRSVRNK